MTQMASKKKYSYYLRGNQLALIEENTGLGSGTCSLSDYKNQSACENAGGTWTAASSSGGDLGVYKSPQESITDGLEIEYAYSPRYSITTAATTQINKFYINGWTVVDGYLTFLRSHDISVPSWDASPYSAVGDGEYIVIKGSSRWSGLHRVRAGATDGRLETYTKVHQSVPIVLGSSNIDIYGEGTGGASATQARIIANDSSNVWLNAIFSTNDYIFITGSAVAKNNGFWQVSGVQDDSSAESSSGIYVTNRYFCYDGDNTLSTEGEDTSPDTTLATDESVSIYKAHRDFCYFISDINTLNDEADVIDLPEYLAKALIYYIRAQLAEDRGDSDQYQSFRKQFRALMQRYENSRIWGSRRVAPGIGAIR